MTYFGFLLRFLCIPILVLLAIRFWHHKRESETGGFRNGRLVWAAIAVHVLLAVAYTTPWDNYLVATGVWYYNPTLVTGWVIGYVPIEEYTFFVLETILAGLWWWFLAERLPLSSAQVVSSRRFGYTALSAKGLLIYTGIGLPTLLWFISAYLFFFGAAKWVYLSIILFWALPPVILQLLFGADILWGYRKLITWAIVVPAMYLSFMDIVALKGTTWSISVHQTTGILFFGILPLEEILFFFVTNMLIAFGLTLLMAPASQARFTEIRKQVQAWKERQLPGLRSR